MNRVRYGIMRTGPSLFRGVATNEPVTSIVGALASGRVGVHDPIGAAPPVTPRAQYRAPEIWKVPATRSSEAAVIRTVPDRET